MMKKIYYILGLGLLFALALTRCKDPLDNVTLNVSSDIIAYSTVLQIEDGFGNPVNEVNVQITGQDADAIYNMEGYKDFHVNNGLLTLGVDPGFEPTPERPVVFTVKLSKNGFLTQTVPVVIAAEQAPTVLMVNMLNIAEPPVGVSVSQQTEPLVNNATAREVRFGTDRENFAELITAVTIPAGTQFMDADGNLLAGSTLQSTIITLDPSKPEALKVFPGGSLSATNVVGADGNAASGVFNPAAVANVDLSVDGAEVRGFSQPILIGMELDPAFTNLSTGQVVQAGDELDVYSYRADEGQWKYEKKVAVSADNGTLMANIETDHLTWFMVGNFVPSCANALTVNLNGSWMKDGFDYPLTVSALIDGKVISSVEASVRNDNSLVSLGYLPASGITIQVSTSEGEILANEAINSGCSNDAFDITLAAPAEGGATVSLQLYVRCPLNNEPIAVIPTFYVYYREPASQNDQSGFQLLGIAKNGYLNTTKLEPNRRYDFRAMWGNKVRTLYNRQVSETNEGTVGDQPGDIRPSENDLDFVKENCGG